jgi:hypothetical protein
MRFSIGKPSGVLGNVLSFAPLLAAIVFVQLFARALPLTDEWFYIHAIRKLHDVDLLSFSGLTELAHLYPTRFHVHLVGFPFVLYWPIAEWTNFDSRWIIYLTVAAFVGQAVVYRKYLVPSSWAVLPIILVLCSPAHFMEFLWGWQITLSFSVVFPLVGLAVINRITDAGSPRMQTIHLAIGVGCFLAGTASSAGGFFGFPVAIVLLALKDLDRRTKIISIAAVSLIAVAVYFMVMRVGQDQPLTTGMREVWYVFTAMGATLWGSPVGLVEFGFDARSAAGLAIALFTIAIMIRAIVLRAVPKLALALSIALFGYLCVAPIAMSRPYLGNWHVQYALPAVCGAYAAAYILWRLDRSAIASVIFFGLVALLTSGLFGYYKGFSEHGPGYLNYVSSIEQHVIRSLEQPGLTPPYPPQGGHDLDVKTILFLSAHGHPLFADLPMPQSLAPLPPMARVYVDERELSRPWRIENGNGKVAYLTVVVPAPLSGRGVRATLGGTTLILHRVHPQYTPEASGRDPEAVSFMGALVPHFLPDGAVSLELAVFQ